MIQTGHWRQQRANVFILWQNLIHQPKTWLYDTSCSYVYVANFLDMNQANMYYMEWRLAYIECFILWTQNIVIWDQLGLIWCSLREVKINCMELKCVYIQSDLHDPKTLLFDTYWAIYIANFLSMQSTFVLWSQNVFQSFFLCY